MNVSTVLARKRSRERIWLKMVLYSLGVVYLTEEYDVWFRDRWVNLGRRRY